MNLKYWFRNPRYFKYRVLRAIWEMRHNDTPWLTPDSIKFLDSYLRSSDIGLEWGSGRSTVWFARRVYKLISVETNEHWYVKVRKKLEEEKLKNVDLYLVPESPDTEYIKPCLNIPKNSLDFVLIDGKHRHLATEVSIPLLKKYGLLIIDNINRYLPSPFRIAPGSVSETKPEWRSIEKMLRKWRCYWTSDGVTETAIYFKDSI